MADAQDLGWLLGEDAELVALAAAAASSIRTRGWAIVEDVLPK